MGRSNYNGKSGGPLYIKCSDPLPWAVQKWLNLSICRLGCGLGWAEGSTSSIVFARWRQCALMGGHIRGSQRIRLNRLSAAAIRPPYVKLLWPLVFIIIRPHPSTTYVGAAYCYRRSSVVYLSVCMSLLWALQKRLNRSRCRLGCGLGGPKEACVRWACTLTQPGEYDWTVHVLWRRGLLWNYFDY